MDTCELIRALRAVPEFRLLLIELAWEVVGDDGNLDPEKLAFCGKELKEAIDEAEAYTQGTKEAVQCLRETGRS